MNEIPDLIKLRVVVGFLGEKSQNDWWSSDFFGAAATNFLDPLFPRTRFLAQVEGACSAAGRLHDERIGIGRVFHLFRLPEDFERAFHECLNQQEIADAMQPVLETQEAASNYLETKFGKASSDAVGPVMVGDIKEMTDERIVKAIGQHYLAGFKASSPVFPYLKDEL